MLILGLGSNVGNRLAYLREAYTALKEHPDISVIRHSPIYESDALLPEKAPEDWDNRFFNAALACETKLSPEALLATLKTLEKSIGRQNMPTWGPRVIDIDILAWDDLVLENDRLCIPHRHLTQRPFALFPLSDIAPFWQHPLENNQPAFKLARQLGDKFSGDAPLHTKQIRQRLTGPKLVGVLNLTSKSFSFDQIYKNPALAIERAREFVRAGAEVIDIGAESTSQNIWNTGEGETNSENEWERLESVLKNLKGAFDDLPCQPKISIDTRHPETAEKCLAYGVDWINDVTGLDNPQMRSVLKDADVEIVFMHHLGIPPKKEVIIPPKKDPVQFVLDWANTRLEELDQDGFSRGRLIFDCGLGGFGKTPEQSIELIQRAKELRALDLPILLGHSRKSLLSCFTNKPAIERDNATVAITYFLAQQHTDYLRVHNVEMNNEFLRVMDGLS
ncbi:MAG: dihydropteroate synthase [Gammaproteobacteria bacterium]